MFRGREMAHTDLGRKILDRLIAELGDSIVVESMPKQEGRNMIMVIGTLLEEADRGWPRRGTRTPRRSPLPPKGRQRCRR